MSHSSEDDLPPIPSPPPLTSASNKKRRIQNQRACDRCRQKKSWSFVHPYSLTSLIYLVFSVRCMSFSFFPINLSDVLQAMGSHQFQSVHIVHRLVVIVSLRSLPRCFFSLAYPALLMIDHSSSPKKTRGPPKRYRYRLNYPF